MTSAVRAERFASGLTFDQYVEYIGTPANLGREGSGGRPRQDYSVFFRDAFEKSSLTEAQGAAWTWLVNQPDGPAKMLVISEDWSSDCRRDVPTFARLAAQGGLELRIFRRDGQRFSDSHAPTLAGAPDSNADLMAEFLNHKHGQTWQSIPVCAFYTRTFDYLYHYTEYPAIYEKDRIVPKLGPEFPELQRSAFFQVWASAAVDEIISALHRRLVLGAV
jgi:hypothetical protein